VPLTGPRPAPGYGALLLRGLLAGLIAGLIAGVFAYAAGEPHIDAAIAIEEQTAGVHDHGGDAVVSRTTQRAGLILATTLYGTAMGGLLATGYTLLRRRLRTTHDTRAAIGLAAAALLGAVGVPYLKYPPNPPAVGDPSTVNQRTASYLALLVIGLVAVWAAVVAARSVTTDWARAAAGTATFTAVVTAGYLLLPPAEPAPDGFPATLLWDFRIASLGTQVVLWTALGLAYAALLHHRTRDRETAPATP
jgi:hypothetical protein